MVHLEFQIADVGYNSTEILREKQLIRNAIRCHLSVNLGLNREVLKALQSQRDVPKKSNPDR